MPDRTWLYWSLLSLAVLTIFCCLWALSADAYMRLFLDRAVTRFICYADMLQIVAFFRTN